ncbi:dTMP kinase [Candidatus Bipolaricaulota bacterium]|nr:dTMP kinase [Candidatus Bipolaricaulota bacterium]
MEGKREGKFFVFEGLDGSGTTTQVNLLSEYLEDMGYSVLVVEEPGGTDLGREVRELLLEDRGVDITGTAELFLYEVSRAQLVREKLIPELDRGRIVISDRFALSSVAYQGYGRGVPIADVKRLNAVAVNGVKPDLTFFLDIDLKAMGTRTLGKEPDRIEKESEDFYLKVRRGYLKEVANRAGHTVINGSLSKGEIHEMVLSQVCEELAELNG